MNLQYVKKKVFFYIYIKYFLIFFLRQKLFKKKCIFLHIFSRMSLTNRIEKYSTHEF